MKHIFALLLFLASVQGFAREKVFPLNKKSVYQVDTLKWLYYPGDDPKMAQPTYNDSAWIVVAPHLNMHDSVIRNSFKGICWFRLYLNADSSITGRPLSFTIEEAGASELYLDGRKLVSYGKIAGKDNSEYEDPQNEPFAFVIKDTGLHVFAIRYANYNAESDYKKEFEITAGPDISIKNANDSFLTSLEEQSYIAVITMLLFGIFLALSFMHLLMFLYTRNDLSNIYFAGFSLGFGLILLFTYFIQTTTYPGIRHKSLVSLIISITVMCCSLSGFMNQLFSKNKGRFRVVAILCGVNVLAAFFSFKFSGGFCVGLIIYTTVESLILLVVALYKKKEGSRIIGGGFLLFLTLMLMLIFSSFFHAKFSISIGDTSGIIWIVLASLSILSMPISFSAFLASRFAKMSRNLKLQLTQVQLLSEKAKEQEAEKQRLLENRQTELEKEVGLRTAEVVQQKDEIQLQHNALKEAKKKSDDLLLNILPEEVAEELKEKGRADARLYNEVSVLFTDFVDFTVMSEQLTPSELVAEIDHCFKAFDNIITQFGLEKIKTIGDAYMAVCGLPAAHEDHAAATMNAAIAIRDFMVARKAENSSAFTVRIGVHSGPVVAGIVGFKKFAYDIWGDTVNTAARMEQHGEAGKVNISGATYDLVKDKFKCEYRGELEAKHKGKMSMYFVEIR